jgi:tetratricopeptide (TPR) repeat protein
MADAGRALLEVRQAALAKELLEKAAAADPSAGLDLDVAIAVFETGGAADGLRRLDRIPAARRGADYHLARAQMLNALGKPEEAIAAMHRAIDTAPRNPDLYWQASVLLRRNEREAEAAALLSKAEEAMPREAQIPVLRATLLEFAQKTDEALRLLETVQRRWPELPAAWVARGLIFAAHGRHAEARDALRTALSLGARSPEALAHLTDSILRSGSADAGDAASAIHRALRLAPGDPWIRSLAARIGKDAAAKPVEAPDPRRLFETRPPREW